jgi:hypothetical protein
VTRVKALPASRRTPSGAKSEAELTLYLAFRECPNSHSRNARRIAQLIALVAARRPNVAVPLKLGATALAGALVTSATIEDSIVDPPQPKLEITRLATVRNETVVYRQERPTQPNADQHYSETEQIEASDQIENDDSPTTFARSVQIVRFVNPDESPTTGAPRGSIREDIIKIGSFVTFRPKDDAATADDKGSTLPCTRARRSVLKVAGRAL